MAHIEEKLGQFASSKTLGETHSGNLTDSDQHRKIQEAILQVQTSLSSFLLCRSVGISSMLHLKIWLLFSLAISSIVVTITLNNHNRRLLR